MNVILQKLKTGITLIFKQPQALVIALGQYGLFNFLPDDAMLRLVYRAEMHNKLDLKAPILFSEKLQWLKLYDRNARYTQMVDKYSVRKVIAEKYGDENLIPLIGVYEKVDDIAWEALPERFVMKCTHGSGCNIVCKDKKTLCEKSTREQLKIWIRKNWFYFGREWPYREVTPRIIIEQYMTDSVKENDLTDYKFYCFEGKPLYCQVIGDRHIQGEKTVYSIDFYDRDWQHMPFTGMNPPGHPYPHAQLSRSKPKSYEKMIDIAQDLAQGTHFVRIDFYEIEGKPKFGEFTLYPLSGLGELEPREWNQKLGDLIQLPTDKTRTQIG